MKKYSLFNRIISLVLSLVLVASCLPAGMLTASAAGEDAGVISTEIVTDASTLNAWKDTAFNPYDLTTEHAGGVWTDKSVLKASDVAAAFPNVSGLDVDENNFLVALSALGANSVIAGQGTTPTDTIFVLDVSNSMENGDLLAMVRAANDAIHTLLEANEDNRIGVVVYATNVNVLLPLDRYTPVQKGANTNTTNDDEIAYIEMNSGYSQIRTARVTSGSGFNQRTTYIKDSDGDDVSKSISASGATYIQGGLWEAYEMFDGATVTDTRTPVLVLMSDGAPTYGTTSYANVNINSRNVGNGGTDSVTDGLAFLTQLTAAYVKEKISDKYDTAAYFYSVGLNISESNNVSIAETVLDTSKTRNTSENHWQTYLGLANAQNKTMRFNAAGSNITITFDGTVTESSKDYTDRYFPADDASQLGAAFQGIVNEINLKSSYIVTRLEGVDVNTGGYVTFVDEIGTGMEVKDIKGILIGNRLFSGEMLAKAAADGDFGTEAAPTALGLNQIWALQNRLRMEATDTQTAAQRVWELLRQARNAGQISYSANSYSNYIGWFGDAEGKFVGFWDTKDETPVIPAGATHANMCYGMLGTTTDSQTAHASDMMYVAITVSKAITDGQIKDNTPQTVTFRVPASLLPTITYQIDVQAANDEQITENTPATITYNPAEPIRLLYEVGVHSKLNGLNIKDFLREGYQAKDADGNYYLYTNAWYWEPSDGSAADFSTPPTKDNEIGKDVLYDTAKNHITYAYFEPGVENEHYYYTEDTVLYTRNGSTYTKLTTAPVTDGSVQYYFQHKVFEATATETGVAVDAKVEIHYGKVSPKLLQTAANIDQGSDGVYYIKEGTMHYGTIHDHDREKASNDTGSYLYRLHQLVDIAVSGGENAHQYEIAYLGNNGRITYAPAQGLKLSKVMNDGSAPDATFTFEVALTTPAGQTLATDYETVRVAANGTETTGTAEVAAGKLTVSLKPGESIYILGLPTGTSYTVTEKAQYGYLLASAQQDTGVIGENAIAEAVFTNMVQQYGALTVSKWVTYEDGVNPAADDNTFDVTVTLKNGEEAFAGDVYVGTQQTAVTDGKVTFEIKHGQEVVISDIPVGVTYTVAEDKTTLPDGYTWENEGAATLSGTMDADGQVAELENTYNPDDVIVDSVGTDLILNVEKTYIHKADNGGTYQFDFVLQRYDSANQQWTAIDSDDTVFVVSAKDTYTKNDIVLEALGQHLTAAGDYYFRIAEVIPDAEDQIAGMTYDRAHHDFKVVVTDKDLDGKLEIDNVVAVDDTVTVTYHPSATNPDASYWSVATGFTNTYETKSTKLTIEAAKTLTGAMLKDGQFEFALYETEDTFDITGKTPVTVRNGANGDIVFPTATYPYVQDGPDYYYVMKEVSTNGNGITVDSTVWEIWVDVTYPDSGEASVAKVLWRKQGETDWTNHVDTLADNVFNKITFENTYEAEDATYQITGDKTLTNLTAGVTDTEMTVPGGTYSFTVEAVTAGAPLPAQTTVTAAQGGDITFGAITFDAVGTYTYQVSENNTNVPGVTKDNTVYTVEIAVTDNGLGQLVAAATYYRGSVRASDIVFNNTYTAAPTGNIVLGGGKELTVKAGSQRDLQPGEFFFTLTKPDGSTETVSNTLENGTRFAFSPITFNAVGLYTYTIQEVVPHGAVNDKRNGITYASIPLSVPIEVYDDGSGTLKAKVLNNNLNDEGALNYVAHFENFYEAAPATVNLTAHKDLEGRDLANEEFSFRIEAITAGAPMPENPTAKNDENGNVKFAEMTFSAVGVYQYKVTELDKDGGALTQGYTHNGVTYSQKVYTVTVTVRDTGNGNLVAHVESVDENGDAQPGGVVFTNTYEAAPVKAEITATKELYNLTGGGNAQLTVPADTYKFKLEALNGAPAPQAAEVYAAQGGAVTFGQIEYTAAGTYAYKLTEIDVGKGGVTSDDSEYTVEVVVKDNLQGSLVVESLRYIKENTGYSEAIFTNKYAAKSASEQISANKVLTNLTPGVENTQMEVPADTYKFKLEAVTPDAPLPVDSEVYAAQGGVVTFGEIAFTKAGLYEYKLSEIDMNVAGVDNDDSIFVVKVSVIDDGEGQLRVANVVYLKEGDPAAPTFLNTYKAESVKLHVEGESTATDGKIFTDESSLPENKKTLDDFEFAFTLSKPGGEIVQTVVDNGAGFAFDEIEYTAVGEYQYLIYERPTGYAGVTFDYSKYLVTVTVTDGGEGQLVADVKYEKASSGESDDYQTVDGVVFENSYKAKEVTVSFSGTKTLTGRALKDKEFSFILKDAKSGETITTVMNDAQGKLCFPSVTYNAEGTFTYLLEEKIEAAKGITYDKAQYAITVAVEDVNGELQAAITVTKDGEKAEEITFANVYTPEKTPEKEPEKTPEIDSPKTGDDFHANAWTLMMAVSAIGLLAVLLLGRKKEQTAE